MSQDNKKFYKNFCFWLQQFKLVNNQLKKNWEDQMINICTVSNIEEFWTYFGHMVRPREIPIEYGFSIFQEGIKPAWEDKANLNGGRFILRIKKQFSNYFWETLLLSFVTEGNDLICGLASNSKDNEVTISIWIKNCESHQILKIKDWIRRSLNLSKITEFEYRDHPTMSSYYDRNKKRDSRTQIQQDKNEHKVEKNILS